MAKPAGEKPSVAKTTVVITAVNKLKKGAEKNGEEVKADGEGGKDIKKRPSTATVG